MYQTRHGFRRYYRKNVTVDVSAKDLVSNLIARRLQIFNPILFKKGGYQRLPKSSFLGAIKFKVIVPIDALSVKVSYMNR